MQAMGIRKYGDVGVFEEISMEKPQVKPGHVLIKVMATSVNPLDYKLRQGYLSHLMGPFPIILHGDVAGVVVAVGDHVTQFSIGDEVYGCAGGLRDMPGALAEYLLADADLIAHKPKKLSFAEAAALPLVALTAWEAFVTYAHLKPNQTVLVHGGTGGVGHIAIQLAKALGAKVYTTVSSLEKAAVVQQWNINGCILYRQTSVEDYVKDITNGEGFDIVFDTVGGENLPRCLQAAGIYGQVVSIQGGGTFDLTPAFTKGLSIHMVLQPLPLVTGKNRAHYGSILKEVATLVDQGAIKPMIDSTTFTIRQVADAHQHLESGRALGKVVLVSDF